MWMRVYNSSNVVLGFITPFFSPQQHSMPGGGGAPLFAHNAVLSRDSHLAQTCLFARLYAMRIMRATCILRANASPHGQLKAETARV